MLYLLSTPIVAAEAAAIALTGCSKGRRKQNQESEKPRVTPAYFKVDASTAGTIAGKVLIAGKRPQRKIVDMDEDPQCRKLHKTAVINDAIAVNRNGTMANVFVYVKEGLDGK